MNEFLASLLMIVGGVFLLLAAVGIVKMPDLFTRMQAATKAATLGISCMLLAVALHMDDLGLSIRALLTIVFFLLTAPVAAHMIGRAAYFVGVPLWQRTITDELKGQYDLRTHALVADRSSNARPTDKP
ncbi:MAG TPA: monovalent cation/H(+) antiporter subunit G [Candidatus Eisenbacteria bacterium]|nr:monovalent cation/H(+) antiporter subunit G [Candidatus Eisenbacteria bacterium]